ncbi:ATP-dependent Clp protease ATP-binding subunit CLPT1, chloroplastic-like [Quercus robur]|uniref:ATP-dependent Clp protease ATP-binding subunit CLPT1, chloroplastic-like n=1 Tax=Quercus robur TaxID=38942 RepID=UPI0021634A34|nr:ATP-dependent Clp protease ATP-binding subunit CLPT1, chloroplastic-like [Quercus robur]
MASHTLSALPISQSCHRLTSNSSSSSSSSSSLTLPWRLNPHNNLVSSLIGNKLSIQPSTSKPLVSKHRSPVATVLSSLPTRKPEGASSEKTPKWSARAIKSFGMAELEARKIKYPNTGTESLLMGILVEG